MIPDRGGVDKDVADLAEKRKIFKELVKYLQSIHVAAQNVRRRSRLYNAIHFWCNSNNRIVNETDTVGVLMDEAKKSVFALEHTSTDFAGSCSEAKQAAVVLCNIVHVMASTQAELRAANVHRLAAEKIGIIGMPFDCALTFLKLFSSLHTKDSEFVIDPVKFAINLSMLCQRSV